VGSAAYIILWVVNRFGWEKVMEQLLEALRQQFDEATIKKGQELLEDILDIVNQNGEAGYISGNLYYSLMCDELDKFSEGIETGGEDAQLQQ